MKTWSSWQLNIYILNLHAFRFFSILEYNASLSTFIWKHYKNSSLFQAVHFMRWQTPPSVDSGADLLLELQAVNVFNGVFLCCLSPVKRVLLHVLSRWRPTRWAPASQTRITQVTSHSTRRTLCSPSITDFKPWTRPIDCKLMFFSVSVLISSTNI